MSRDQKHNPLLDVIENEMSFGGSSNPQFEFLFYLHQLLKNIWPILVFTTCITAAGAYYSYTTDPIYKSTATLQIDLKDRSQNPIDKQFGVEERSGDFYDTQYEILRSRKIAERVVKKLELDKPTTELPAIDIQALEQNTTGTQYSEKLKPVLEKIQQLAKTLFPDVRPSDSEELFKAAVTELQTFLEVKPAGNRTLVNISYQSPDPITAAKVAMGVAEEHMAQTIEDQNKKTLRESVWLNKSLIELKDKITKSESQLEAFKQENGLINVSGGISKLNERELSIATFDLVQAQSKLADSRSLYREANSLRNSSPEILESLPSFQNDPALRNVQIDIAEKQQQLDRLSNRYGSRHPNVLDVRTQIETLNKNKDRHISRIVSSLETSYRSHQQRVNSIQETLSLGKEKIQLLGVKKFELDSLERELKVDRELYDRFQSYLIKLTSTNQFKVSSMKIIEPAIVPTSPIKPNKILIILSSALFAIVISLAATLIVDKFDDSVRGARDVQSKLGIKLLGVASLISRRKIFGRKLSISAQIAQELSNHSPVADSINAIRTSLCIDEGSLNKVILITSSIPGEGKSKSAINLAHSFSKTENVLLIDADMRQPSIASYIDLNFDSPGLSNMTPRNASAKAQIHRNAIGAVDVMTSGPSNDRPLDLLASEKFRLLLKELKPKYDRVIIDSAPVHAVSDSLILSNYADAVIYVVKSHDTSHRAIKRGLLRLKEVNAPLAGILLTRVEKKRSSFSNRSKQAA